MVTEYSYDRTAATSLKGSVPFKVEITKSSSVGTMKITVQLEGGVGVGKGYEKFKASVKFSDGKITGMNVQQGSDLVKGALWTKEVEAYIKDHFG